MNFHCQSCTRIHVCIITTSKAESSMNNNNAAAGIGYIAVHRKEPKIFNLLMIPLSTTMAQK